MDQYFEHRIIRCDQTGCWHWVGTVAPNGYGRCSKSRGSQYAHRAVYMAVVGPIPPKMDLDHLCRVRKCVNPDHLEPVTRSENLRRGETGYAGGKVWKVLAARTHCKNGHAFSPENTYWRTRLGTTNRRCRRCHANYELARQARNRQ